MSDPSISIITVAYNSSATIARTMESVLKQSVLPTEYLIIDGASTDNTVETAEGFRQAFEDKGVDLRVVSEPDEGIYDAMNKGISMARGDIIGMINSDDWYEPCAVETVINAYKEAPFDLFYADLKMHMPSGGTFVKHSRNRRYATSRDWNHPTTFISAQIYKNYRYRNETIHDDYDLILRIKKAGAKITVKNVVIANFTMNGTSHERSIGKAIKRAGIKYRIYRDNGYSRLYFFECFVVETAKLIIG
ncbi:MAG: glycosyltransferase [Lachnospiraceae bacterium]|nr:glycosyltransferase [Lachnospiraceae bacterium]